MAHRILLRHVAASLGSAALLALTSPGCGEGEVEAPEGVACDAVTSASGSADALSSALAKARPGECVVLGEGTYAGAFALGPGVRLVAAEGASPVVQGSSADAPALDVAGAPGSRVQGITVSGSAGTGVRVRGATASLVDLEVKGSGGVGVAIACDGAECLAGEGVRMTSVRLSGNERGLDVRGARLRIEGGSIRESAGTSLTAGVGVLIAAGADVEAEGTVVEANQYGMVIDGESGTKAHLTDLEVLSNTERGVWAQRLSGTLENPALLVDGDGTRMENNSLTALGVLESRGIIIVSGRFGGTTPVPIVAEGGKTEQVGDGIGLFAGTGDARLEGVSATGSFRAQVLVDKGARGIIIVSGRVEPDGGAYGVVVQNTEEDVEVDPALVSDAPPLLVSAPLVQIAAAP